MGLKVKLTSGEEIKSIEDKKFAKKLAVIEAKRQLKRGKLMRELKLGEISRKKLENKFKDMVLHIKAPVLRRNFEFATFCIQYTLDTKDFIISLLLDELDEGEKMYLFNLGAYCEKMKKINDIYRSKLDVLKKDFDEEVAFCKREEDTEHFFLKTDQEKADNYLKTMIFGLSCEEKRMENMARSFYMSKSKGMEHQMLRMIDVKRVEEETIFENIWKKFVRILDNYNSQIKNISDDYFERNKNILIENINKEQKISLSNKYCELKKIKEKQEYEKENVDKTIGDLDSEREYFNEVFLELRKYYVEDVKLDKEKITCLVVESNDNIKALEKKLVLGERILRLNAIVRKLETQKEKIMPRPKMKKTRVVNLKNFWRKCAMVDTTRNTINEEYCELWKENIALKESLNYYLKINNNTKLPPIDRKSSMSGFVAESKTKIVRKL